MYYRLGIAILFAGFFAVHAVLTVAAALTRGAAERWMAAWRPKLRARVLLGFNLAPAGGALVAAGLLATSFLLYEPRGTGEGIGWVLGLGAVFGAVGLLHAGWKIWAVRRVTRKLVLNWERGATPAAIPGWSEPAYRLEHAFPLIAVVGVWRPRLFVASKVLENLESDELSAAIAHEFGHVRARDNFKRLLVNFCGDLAWWVPGAASLRARWADAAELAADEFAAARSGAQPLNLASALVKLARITPAGARPAMPAGAFLVEAPGDILTQRVNWLMRTAPAPVWSEGRAAKLATAAAVLIVGFGSVIAMRADLLARIHELIERIVQ